MLEQILSFMHNLTTMLFGIYISAFFLGVKKNRKNILTLFLLFAFEGSLYIAGTLLFGMAVTDRLYAVIIHLPLIVFLNLCYKYSIISSCISVFSAYLFCQMSNWIGLLLLTITDSRYLYYVSRILITVIVFVFLCKVVCRTTEIIFTRDRHQLYIIGFLPTVYYVFDYSFTKISKLLYSNNKAVVEFLGFIFCIAYLVFLLVYFREYEEKREMKQYSDLMEMQLLSVEKEIEQIRRSKQKLSILKHDMRHHLNIILTRLQNDNVGKAIDYIREIGDQYDDTTITVYCQNEVVNSIVSIYQMRFCDKNITLNCNICVGEGIIPCPDIAIGAILSNALENAMHVLEETDLEEKWTNLTVSEKKKHLLIQIENPIAEAPQFVDGVPVSDKKGHGVGVKSIIYYVERLNGQCHFSVADHTFVLRIII